MAGGSCAHPIPKMCWSCAARPMTIRASTGLKPKWWKHSVRAVSPPPTSAARPTLAIERTGKPNRRIPPAMALLFEFQWRSGQGPKGPFRLLVRGNRRTGLDHKARGAELAQALAGGLRIGPGQADQTRTIHGGTGL